MRHAKYASGVKVPLNIAGLPALASLRLGGNMLTGAIPGLALASCHTDRARFNIYGKTDQEVARFAKWVKQLPRGRVVCICITDTAVAAKRPPGAQLYEALGELGAPAAMEKIGYRFPFAMLGAKGLPRGEAIVLMDKTKFLLRIDATVARGKDGAVTFEDVRTEKTDITTKVILSDGV